MHFEGSAVVRLWHLLEGGPLTEEPNKVLQGEVSILAHSLGSVLCPRF